MQRYFTERAYIWSGGCHLGLVKGSKAWRERKKRPRSRGEAWWRVTGKGKRKKNILPTPPLPSTPSFSRLNPLLCATPIWPPNTRRTKLSNTYASAVWHAVGTVYRVLNTGFVIYRKSSNMTRTFAILLAMFFIAFSLDGRFVSWPQAH